MTDPQTASLINSLQEFAVYAKALKGDEKSEAQLFCDRLFRAFGHAGLQEAGATLETRVRSSSGQIKFADLIWPGKVLIEMKKKGENLQRHYSQAFEYWTRIVPHRPKYVILCNFNEFWIYDFDNQLDEPMDRLTLDDLTTRYNALNFLLPIPKKPLFQNDLIAVTKSAAAKVSRAFNEVLARESLALTNKYDKTTAESLMRVPVQRFILQSVIAMFSEDAGLLPKGLFSELLDECRNGQSSYDLIGGLFRQMNSPNPARAGRYFNVRYFNGGIFSEIDPIELSGPELHLLQESARENWARVKPSIFGTLFQSSMGQAERHAFGAHYTSEADIQKVVLPTIVAPWRERIAATDKLKDLKKLRDDLLAYRVLDPACGSGNFLYIAYRELKRIELELIGKVQEKFGRKAAAEFGTASHVSTRQFFGLDIVPFAVELAKVTLMICRQLALTEQEEWFRANQPDLPLDFDPALPLDNLDENIICTDALFTDWPAADAIIGNPPFQSKNKAQEELGPAYLQRLRERYPEVPGRADYCVYWFYKAHQQLKENGRAGLVGTNTIRQNYSREGSLDYIVNHGGTIIDAVSTQVWSGDAAVHVSIVNWVKGNFNRKKQLSTQKGDNVDSEWFKLELDNINPALSLGFDVTRALKLQSNSRSKCCFQGQTHGHEGFLLSKIAMQDIISKDSKSKNVIFPFLTANEMLSNMDSKPDRFVIDMQPMDIFEAKTYKLIYDHLLKTVLPTREKAAKDEEARNSLISEKKKGNSHHANFLKKWWLLSYGRGELLAEIEKNSRYVVCGQVTKRPIFEFVSKHIRPNAALIVFPLHDDYSFGILQSGIHFEWFKARCSTLKGDYRYTSDTVFDTFPWPQKPTNKQIEKVAAAAVALRKLRREIMTRHGWSLRDLYRTLETPGTNPLRTAHEVLDKAIKRSLRYERFRRHSGISVESESFTGCKRRSRPTHSRPRPAFFLSYSRATHYG